MFEVSKRASWFTLWRTLVALTLTTLLANCASAPAKLSFIETFKHQRSSLNSWFKSWNQQSDAEKRIYRQELVAFYRPTKFSTTNALNWSQKLPSEPVPMVAAIIEFKKGNNLIPLYRYVVLPVKQITAEELLKRGPYLSFETKYRLPARTPTKTTKGALITDWHYCYACFSATPVEDLTPAKAIKIDKHIQELYQTSGRANHALIFVDQPEDAVNLNSIELIAGTNATRRQIQDTQKSSNLQGQISSTRSADKTYSAYWEQEVEPLTYESHSRKQGCPTDYHAQYDRVGAYAIQETIAKRIRSNQAYIDCHTRSLESFDPKPYQTKLPELITQEAKLWGNSSKTLKRGKLIAPALMVDQAADNIDAAISGSESLERQLDNMQEAAERSRRHEASRYAVWQSTLDSIRARNELVNQQTRDLNRMISQIQKAPTPNKPRTAYPTQTKPKPKPQTEPKPKPSAATKTTLATQAKNQHSSEASAQVESPAPKVKPKDRANQVTKAAKTRETPNQFVGSGRDYPFTGSSGSYLPIEVSKNTARISLLNQAAEFCEVSSKAHITWSSDFVCKKSNHEDQYQCTRDGLVNCYEQRCKQAFCGTKNP